MGDTTLHPPAVAFAMRHMPEPNSGCWLWTGSYMQQGYGVFYSKWTGEKVATLAHRASWELHSGAIPEGMCVCHRCDNPACVNPDHLFLGTNQDNVDDKVKKGRQSRLPGERNPKAKLTEGEVSSIRLSLAAGADTVDLALRYGVTLGTIHHIAKRLTWKHVA